MKHFEIEVRPGKYGLKLSRDNYATINRRSSFYLKLSALVEINAYEDSEGRFYTQEWCEAHRSNALANFDINMKFFDQLDPDEFNKQVNKFIHQFPKFKEIHDLKLIKGEAGYYMLVLDHFKQVYIGKTEKCILSRITQHWNGVKSFDRLLLPVNNINGSVLSIDSFRCMDTTRIFVNKSPIRYGNEELYVKSFPRKYLLNRIGGDIDGSDNLAYFKAINTLNQRIFENAKD